LLVEKQAIINFGWTIDDYENADYYSLLEILNAKEMKDRAVDPMSLL